MPKVKRNKSSRGTASAARALAQVDGSGSANGPELRSQRARIIETTAELYFEHGYAGVTMDEVALRLKRTKASLYHHFGTKEDLIVEIFVVAGHQIEKQIWSIFATDLPPDEKMTRTVRKYIELATTSVFFRAAASRGPRDLPEPHKTRVLRLYRVEERKFEQVIVEAQGQGLFRDMEPRLVVLGFVGMCAYVSTWFQYASFTTDEIADVFTSLLERGWIRSAGKRGPRSDAIDRAQSVIAGLRGSADQMRANVDAFSEALTEATERIEKALPSRLRNGVTG